MFSLSGPCDVKKNIYCLLDLSCDVISLSFLCCVLEPLCELLGETIRNIFGGGGYLVVECFRGVDCG